MGGGKSWLARQWDELFAELPSGTYHEPFLGGASVFLALPTRNALLSDLNEDLVETYEQVRDDVEAVIGHLQEHRNTEKYYYSVRSSRPKIPAKRAARFIYLNQTSFNGIYRVNLNGVYNVPYGHRSKHFVEEENLRSVSAQLQGCTITAADFEDSALRASKNDFVFLDPPDTVSHNHNGFIKYNQKLFSMEDQHRLARVVAKLRSRGSKYLLTNAAHPVIAELFDCGDFIEVPTRPL
jgi:DNA adenine methylase